MLQLANFQHFYCTAHIAHIIISNVLQASLTKCVSPHCSFNAIRYRPRQVPAKGKEWKYVWWENIVCTTMTWWQSWATACLSQVCHHTNLCSQSIKKILAYKKTVKRIKASDEHEIHLMASTSMKSELPPIGLVAYGTDFVSPKECRLSHNRTAHIESHKGAHSLCTNVLQPYIPAWVLQGKLMLNILCSKRGTMHLFSSDS